MAEPTKKRFPQYRLYIDESGDHTYRLMGDPSHRYLALLGVWLRQGDIYTGFADALSQFKRDIFGPRPDQPVILHRSDIINRKGPFGILREPGIHAAFNSGLLELLRETDFKMVCVIIDKQKQREQYADPFHPYHYCLAAMLDRYSGWLNYKNTVGDVLAESRGKEEDLQLGQAYRRVYESGTLWFGREHHQRALTSKKLKIRPKLADIAGLQLADILAYPVKQACLIEKGRIEADRSVFGNDVYKAVRNRWNINAWRGQVQGYGKVFLCW